MRRLIFSLLFLFIILSFCTSVLAQNIYELRKLTEDEWLAMSTEERLIALGSAKKHAPNQTFMGDFGKYYDLYKSWGYEFYEQEDRYENYAFRGFEAYNIIEERRRRWSYNEFGDRIARMRHSANLWHEIYSGDGTYELRMPYNYINSTGSESAFVDGVWVARESTDDWSVSVTGAGALRTKFTPLTLSLPNVDGVSIDFQSANNFLKIINSAPLGAYRTYALETNYKRNNLVRRGGVMLRGGRYRRKFGVLTLGANYVNTYGVQGNRERGSEWRGTVSNMAPTPIMVAVRFMDDSPRDNEGGAIVYDVRLKLNGRYRDDIIPQIVLDDITREQTSAITDKLENEYVYPKTAVKIGAPGYDYYNVAERIPKYADYVYLNDLIRGNNSENILKKYSKDLANSYYELTEQAGKPIQADGNKTIVYIFDLASSTEKLNRVEAVATVANDYRIQTSMIYTLESKGGHDPSGKSTQWYKSSYWRTVAQADGNIKDKSNVRTIHFDFGFQIASVIYGFDADFNYRGFKVKGEWVTNSNHYMFAEGAAGTGKPDNIIAGQPPRTGHRWSQVDNAYYITAEKDWSIFGFAGEVFKMGKFYKPYLDYFNYPATDASYGTNAASARNIFSRVALIEDNDDDDMYPDTMLTQRTIGYRILETEDPDGVFPGNDEDNDGIADNNRNINGIPDYDEPFLMFDVDPDEFVFGNDYNNNTIPDFREDDMKMDTPYDLDRQGYHYFVRLTPQKSIDLIAGSFRTRGVGTSIKTNDDYLKFILNYDVFDVGKLYAEYRYEKIQDNFRDPYIQVEKSMREEYLMPGIRSTLGRFERDLYYDELEYRNSRVNRLFLDSKIRAVPSITLENHIKFERNGQVEGKMYDQTYQPHDILNTLAMVNKIVYTKRWGNFVFSPGLKFRFYKKVRSESLLPLDHYMMRIPLVMFKYIISSQTDISFGMQGIPGFGLDYNDYVQSQNDYRQNTYTIQLQNRSGYFGYNVWAAVGVTLDQISYDEDYRQYEEYKSSSTFAKVYLGW